MNKAKCKLPRHYLISQATTYIISCVGGGEDGKSRNLKNDSSSSIIPWFNYEETNEKYINQIKNNKKMYDRPTT